MTPLERMKLRIPEEPDERVFLDCLETAKNAILARRYPFHPWPTRKVKAEDGSVTEETYLEPRYNDLLYRVAVDLYNKTGAEGERVHTENGVSRTYESSWISEQLLSEVVPLVGVIRS